MQSKIHSNWSYKVFRVTALYILRIFALQHPCRISVICFVTVLLFSYRMNESMWKNDSCLYVYVHIVYKMGYTFVNGVD